MPQPRLLVVLQRHPVLLWSLGGLCALLVLLNYVVMPLYVNHGSRLTVPNVVGLTLPQAGSMLDAATLVAVEAETRPDPALPAGTVVHQNPSAGSVVKEGRHVYLTISGGEIQVIVPLLRGRSLREARFTLERHGLLLGDINFTPSDQFPENTIIDQSVSAESRVTKGMHVAITVSRGRGTDQSTIPLLTGKTVAEAQRLLMASGLRVGNVTFQPSFDLIPNTIVDQYPRAGEPAKSGDAVDLFVVKVGRPAEEIKVPGEGVNVLIAASILNADFAHLGDAVRIAEKGGADWIHLDIMDGHFVPNLTFGPPVVASLRPLTRLPFDAHLMIAHPDDFLENFRKAGADRITVHVETCPHLHRTVHRIRELGALPGVSINPATPVSALSEILPDVDLILIMTVNPGFGGQSFIPATELKLMEVSRMIRASGRKIHLQVDGGIDNVTTPRVVRAGADVLVVGKYLFGSSDIAGAIRSLRAASTPPPAIA